MKQGAPVKLLGLVSFGLGLGIFALQRLRWQDSTEDSLSMLFSRASFNPSAPLVRVVPITIIAIYQSPDGQTAFQYLQLPGSSPWQDVVLICQRLATCVLLEPQPSAPTELFSIRVLRGELPLSVYRRNPDKLATALWVRVLGRSLGNLNTARPSCKQPFCTQDAARLAAGSDSCIVTM